MITNTELAEISFRNRCEFFREELLELHRTGRVPKSLPRGGGNRSGIKYWVDIYKVKHLGNGRTISVLTEKAKRVLNIF